MLLESTLIFRKLKQSLKAEGAISCTEEGIFIVLKLQYWNALDSITLRFSGNSILLRDVQFWNAFPEIVSTQSGSLMSTRFVHPEKISPPNVIFSFPLL